MKFIYYLTFILPISFFLVGCQNNSTTTRTVDTQKENTISESSEAINSKDSVVKKAEEIDSLSLYINLLYAKSQLNSVQLKSRFLNGIEKYNFEYKGNLFSIDVNNDGITYKGIYEKSKDTFSIRYASIIPEMYMEGSYINYDLEPWLECYFDNDSLVNAKYHNPKKEASTNLLENIEQDEKIHLGDSIKSVINSYLYLDSSIVSFDGNWAKLNNNDSYSFSAQINQIGSFVSGSYCAYTPAKFDCGVIEQGGDPCYIDGFIKLDTLFLSFLSCYSLKRGEAKLYFKNDTLNWQTIYEAEGSLVPQKIQLK